jgi:hypothetical protein
MRIVGDVMAYTAAHMPKFHPISISGYHMQVRSKHMCMLMHGYEMPSCLCTRQHQRLPHAGAQLRRKVAAQG